MSPAKPPMPATAIPSASPRTVTAAAVVLAVVCLLLLALFPWGGARHWDGWMTASVLSTWDDAPARAIFFFAHPLVIPITRAFAACLPVHDTLLVTQLREACFAAANAALLLWLVHAVTGRLALAVVVALAFMLPYEHVQLVSLGEEKDIMVFFALLAWIPFCAWRGWLQLRWLDVVTQRAGPRIGPQVVPALVGALLALAFAVHLENGLLVAIVTLSTLLRPGVRRSWRRDLAGLVVMGATAGAGVLATFGPLAWWGNDVRSVDDAYRWLFEYHLSGQFLDVDYVFHERMIESAGVLRAYLVGPHAAGYDGAWCAFLLVGAPVVVVRAARRHAPLAASCVLWLVVMAVHFFNYRQDAEAWAGSAVPGLLLLALATPHSPRVVVDLAPWAALVAGLGAVDVDAWWTRRTGDPLTVALTNDVVASRPLLEQRFARAVPETLLALAADAAMPPDAIVGVTSRHVVNAFVVHTARRPFVVGYLDRDDAYFARPDVALTVLSRHFYLGERTSAHVQQAAQQGRPLYVLTTSDALPSALHAPSWTGRWHLARVLGRRARLWSYEAPSVLSAPP